jgi:ribonuclease HII
MSEKLARRSLTELKTRYLTQITPLPRGLLKALERDARRGAQQLAAQLRRRAQAERAEEERLQRLLQYETELWEQGFEFIAGVDEAGVGPMAGPVVAGAVILPRDYKLRQLNDSKKLDEATRERLAVELKRDALAWAVGWAEVEEIDKINVYQATLLASRRAVAGLSCPPDFVLVDGRRITELTAPQRGIIRGDQLSASIAAASIIAKTTRDALMKELDQQYPGYGLAAHKGYATPEHFRVLRERGALPIHRRSYRPVRAALGLEPLQETLFK